MWAIVCLGKEPLVYGPFTTEDDGEIFLRGIHCVHPGLHPDTNWCENSLEWDEHHVLEMKNA